MKFEKQKIQFVYINKEYLRYMYENEPNKEIWFDENNNYEEKPHIGILITSNNYKYVIPLTSAKEKHKTWSDVSASWYRIYEIVNIKSDIIRDTDILVDIKNKDILKTIDQKVIQDTKQKILSVLDIRKMFPIKDGVYTILDMKINSTNSKEFNNKIALLLKEYMFIVRIKDDILEKATKIYDKQITKNKVLKYHCNYKVLEKACDKYSIKPTPTANNNHI